MNSIKYKLLILFLPVLLIALGSVAYINHNKAKEFLEAEFVEKTEVSIQKAQNDIDNYFKQRIKEIEVIANVDVVESMNYGEILPYFDKEFNRLEGYEMLLISDSTGRAKTTAGAEVDISDRDYFISAIRNNETVLSQPLVSRASEEVVVVLATPVRNNDKTVGAVIATIKIDDIVKLVGNYKIGDDGYAFLVSQYGVVIAHPDQSLIMEENYLQSENEKLKEMVSSAISGNTGEIIYNDNGVESYGLYTSIPSTKWGFVIAAPVKEVTSNLSYLAMLSFVTAGVVLCFSAVIVVVFARRLVKPIQNLSDLSTKVASGDLTVLSNELTKNVSNDEVGRLSVNFDTMIKRIQNLLQKIDKVSNTVKTSSDTLMQSSNETREASHQVALTINELASGTTDIADSVTNATENMNTMLGTVQEISQFTNEVVETSTHSKTSAEKGLASAKEAMIKMQDVHSTVHQTSAIIEKLEQQSREIGNIIQIITSIANQTNLLALNASIEAARAGEHGKGFAVVADEVRKLANETSESADKISNLIKETQEESKKAVTSIQRGEVVVNEGSEIVSLASESFAEIAGYVDEVLEKNREIFNSVKNLEAFGQEVGATMESISAVTEEASAGAEELSATTEQQAASANQIAHDASSLAELANELRDILSTFKTK